MNARRLILATMLIVICFLFFYLNKSILNSVPKNSIKELSKGEKSDLRITSDIYQRSIFVPYWQIQGQSQDLGSENKDYDRYIYFGVAGTADGVPEDDPGFEHLDGFLSLSNGSSRWLTVRMTDTKENDKVLSSKDSQKKIVTDAVKIAKKYGFDGLVLDFEYNSLFGGKVEDVTAFYKLFGNNTKSQNLKFAITIYGDVIYRKRPYDLAQIEKYSDEFMIMAYDLHKSRGEPGPNFPFSAGKKYGYGYDLLFNDLEKIVPAEKITIIFGMYGYDWKVDEKERPITPGSSLTTAQVIANYIKNCDSLRCTILKDSVSAETEVDYVDVENKYHIIWFENEESVKKKEEFLRQRGVGSVAFWAYGYF